MIILVEINVGVSLEICKKKSFICVQNHRAEQLPNSERN